jgi:ankyrin repeat protein
VGCGNLDALEGLGQQVSPQALDTPLLNGMTLLQLAAQADQPEAAAWLVEQGATLDIISGWDLDWKDQVRQLLAESPQLANRRLGRQRTTALHEAVHRDDLELVQVVLAANPDLELRDAQFNATPLDWARHLERAEILDLIRQHQA